MQGTDRCVDSLNPVFIPAEIVALFMNKVLVPALGLSSSWHIQAHEDEDTNEQTLINGKISTVIVSIFVILPSS